MFFLASPSDKGVRTLVDMETRGKTKYSNEVDRGEKRQNNCPEIVWRKCENVLHTKKKNRARWVQTQHRCQQSVTVSNSVKKTSLSIIYQEFSSQNNLLCGCNVMIDSDKDAAVIRR